MKTTSINSTVILNWENAFENCDLFNFCTETLETEDILTLFEGDPDMLMIDGERVLFVDININNVRYVVYCDGSYTADNNLIEKILSTFFDNDKFSESFESIEGGWDQFTDNTVAYRGGSGYYYGLSRYVA